MGQGELIIVPAQYDPPTDRSPSVYSRATVNATVNVAADASGSDDAESVQGRDKRQRREDLSGDDDVMLPESRLVDVLEEGRLLLLPAPHTSESPQREENLAPGFENDIVGEMEAVLPIIADGRQSALNIMNTWDDSRNDGLIVMYFVERWTYMKLFRKDYLALRSSLSTYMTDGYKMIGYKNRELGLLEEPISSAIQWQLILCARELEMGDRLMEKLSQLVKYT
ncbi:hypothetical protein F66182_17341, partial [Fusarium sp. NRRL 66182]